MTDCPVTDTLAGPEAIAFGASEAAGYLYATEAERAAYCDGAASMGPIIQRLESENARLRGVLQAMVYETTHLSPCRPDGSHDCRISGEALAAARAALNEKPAQ